ncbi:alpha/beta hydrolase family protein [Williamsia limnetica]|uniref:Alpha/beta hydrolase family protein n=1 Tax=Williamsia limnetica TaxID=882452 RepID=A0A318RIX3_WILLI|nr:alpha/beta hydrolase family protein [Williamsia limnetica]
MDLGDIRAWDVAGLSTLHTTLSSRGDALTDVKSKLQSIGQLPGWQGESVHAARQKFTITADDLSDEIATVSAVQELARQTEVAVEHLQAELKKLESDAASNQMMLHDDGQVTYSTDGKEADEIERLKRAELQIETAARALMTQAADVDSDATAVLRKAASGEITAGDATSTEDIKRTGREQGSLTTDPPAPQLTPLEAKEYWDALSPEQQNYVLSQHPGWVGNVDGIPAAVRDKANRAMIPVERARLEAERKRLQDNIDDNHFGGAFTNEDAALWYVEEKLKDLDAVAAELGRLVPDDDQSTPDRPRDLKLMLLDMTSGERGHAAVAVGDPDTADHVSVTTPGFGTNVNGSLEGMVTEASNLQKEALRQLDFVGEENQTVATIAWIGYDTPNSTGPGNLDTARGGIDVASDSKADDAATDLANFYRGVDAASETSDPHITALGHSYGSVVTSHALQESHGAGVDDAVFYGSPGLGDAGTVSTVNARTLGLDEGDAFVIENEGDRIADFGTYGGDPTRTGDLMQLSADEGVDRTGIAREGGSGHADYPRSVKGPDNNEWLRMAGYNLASVLTDSGLEIEEPK